MLADAPRPLVSKRRAKTICALYLEPPPSGKGIPVQLNRLCIHTVTPAHSAWGSGAEKSWRKTVRVFGNKIPLPGSLAPVLGYPTVSCRHICMQNTNEYKTEINKTFKKLNNLHWHIELFISSPKICKLASYYILQELMHECILFPQWKQRCYIAIAVRLKYLMVLGSRNKDAVVMVTTHFSSDRNSYHVSYARGNTYCKKIGLVQMNIYYLKRIPASL